MENKDRRVRVERLVTCSHEAMTKIFAKQEQLFAVAGRTEDPSFRKQDLETSLNEVTTRNDEILRKACDYIDQCPLIDGASQSSTTVTKSNEPCQATMQNVSFKDIQRIENIQLAAERLADCKAT